jgi:ubiquinone/menaquinone biosynthesis C-methylase UbiE
MKHRDLVPELMDDPSIDPNIHRQALAGLQRVNRLCQTGKYIAREIASIASRHPMQSIRILDLGCGSGDVASDVARRLSKSFQGEVVGADISHTAVNAATQSFAEKKPSSNSNPFQVRFEQADVFQNNLGPYDFVYCCLFLHHFTETQAIELLTQMRRIATKGVIVDDLIRSRWGWLLAKVGCHLLSRSPVVHFDGPQSVRAAFSCKEVIHLAAQAGLQPCQIRRHWPERYLLKWEPSVGD